MKRCAVVFILAFSMVISLCGCQKNAQSSMSPETQERLQEMVQDFVNAIQYDIIPIKDDISKLKNLDIPISNQDLTYGTDRLYSFYDDYGQGSDTSVTIVFSGTSFVITRIIFENGNGYYLRHQYDPKATGPLQVTTRLIDSVKLTGDAVSGKVELELYSNKSQVATLSFKNVDAEYTEKAA